MDYAKPITAAFESLELTHVVWLPDSTLGLWERELAASAPPRLLRVCREGEAWALAAGLYLGGARPIVVLQNTGFFESGDSLRNVLFDMELPLYAIVGYRSYLLEGSRDTARKYTEPVLAAWNIDHVLVASPTQVPLFVDHYRRCQAAGKAGVTLLAEGKG
jgi:sulfopyruvate decarboxylase TPP-binding subunit